MLEQELPSNPQDATRFLDEFRTGQISNLLTVAVCGFDVGGALQDGPMEYELLKQELGLAERPAIVLLTALRSIDLITLNSANHIELTDYGREKMSPQSPFHLRGYIGLGAFSGDVQNMLQCLKHDKPAGDISFVYHEDGPASALDDPDTSDMLTRAMADRAGNVAPVLAEQLDLSGSRCLIDVGGAHGLYSLHLLKKYPELKAIIVDREPALKVAQEYASKFGLDDRVEFLMDDIHQMDIPEEVDAVLMANILHDYNADDAAKLVHHFASSLPVGGRVMIMDAFLSSVDDPSVPVSDGPRAVAAYSGLLFSICEGRCYRFDEAENWLRDAGLTVKPVRIKVPAHGSVLEGVKVER